MQVAIAFLRELFAAPLALEGTRLGVGARVVHCARQDWELALADCAREAQLEATSFGVHHVASLQVPHQQVHI